MNNITKEQAEALIERLVDKNLSFGCRFTIRDELVRHDGLKGKVCRVTGGNHDWEATMFEYEEYFHIQHWADRDIIPTKNLLLEDLLRRSGYDEYESEAEDYITILGHPIMLTDVLEKLRQQKIDNPGEVFGELVYNWEQVGFTKSLQSILQEAEWERGYYCSDGFFPKETDMTNVVHACDEPIVVRSMMKGPAADLFSYLASLFQARNV